MGKDNEQLVKGVAVRQGLKDGVDHVANMVKMTLGPKGMNVLIINNDIPQIINDGVSIAKKMRLWGHLEHAGATMVKNVSKDTDKLYGDGTTTATILAQAILNAGMKLNNVNYFKLKKGFDFYMDEVEKYLTENSLKTKTKEDFYNIAMVSTNGDTEIADLIVQAYKQLGDSCYVSAKESPEKNTYLKEVKGMKYDSGWVSPFLTNDKTDKTAKYLTHEKCYVCYVAGELVNEIDVIPLLELQATDRIPMLIIAERIYGEALSIIIRNKLENNAAISAVVVPGIKSEHADIMADMIAITGGEILGEEHSMQTHSATIESLGVVEGFEVGKDYFTLIQENRDEERVNDRVKHIESEMVKFTADVFHKSAKARIAKLTSGVGVIYIGGNSDIEINEKLLRAQDAINALACGIDKGHLPGGGVALLRAADFLDKKVKISNTLGREGELARKILIDAMMVPYQQILINCGVMQERKENLLTQIGKALFGKSNSYIDKVLESPVFGYGYNGATERFSNLIEDGIVDPLPIPIGALRSAISISSIILSSGGAVLIGDSDKNERIIAGG